MISKTLFKNIKLFNQYCFSTSKILNGSQVELPIVNIETLTENTYIYKLGLEKDQILGILPGEHVKIEGSYKDEVVKRSYTPISLPDQSGFVDILIKLYRPNEKFPEGGKLSTYLDKKKVNDKLTISGPVGRINYLGNGKFYWKQLSVERQFKKLILVAGGSGITPIFQILQQIDVNKESDIEATVLVGNRKVHDILLHKELLDIAERNKNIKVIFTVDENQVDSQGIKTGMISNEIIKEVMHNSDGQTLAICCGPQPMNKVALSTFEEMGYDMDSMFKF